MKCNDTELLGVKLIEPQVFFDNRGLFFEGWNALRYSRVGIQSGFVQDNFSSSNHNVVRGLHFQHPNDQGKLISVIQGKIFDVAVDIRPNSPQYKRWAGFELSDENHHQLWIPPGFAHGFAVLSSNAIVCYKTTDYYSPESEQTIRWDDPDINVKWPFTNPTVSPKDRAGKSLAEIPSNKLPRL